MIYYVEDDDNIRELVVYTLTQMNLPCRGFADGAAFRAAIAAEVSGNRWDCPPHRIP